VNVIVGNNSIVMEYKEKVYRFALDKEFTPELIRAIFDSIKSNFAGEYENLEGATQQGLMLNVEDEFVIVTKMPI